jgi:hypothetical protein
LNSLVLSKFLDNVKKVQASVRNYTGINGKNILTYHKIIDYAPVKAGEWEVPPEKEIPTIQVPIQNKFVQ